MTTPTNPYYQRVFSAIGGSLARVRQLINEFVLIQRGFDLIKDRITTLEGSALHKPLSVVGTANQVAVATNATGTTDVATVGLPARLIVPGTAEYADGEPIGFKNIEQETVAGPYTTTLDDVNRSKVHPAGDGAQPWVLDNLAYRRGAAITLINEVGAGAITLTAAGGDFLMLGTGTKTTITIAPAGGCTVIRIAGTNRWSVAGAGITGA